MDRAMIDDSYYIQELKNMKQELRVKLQNNMITEEEKWDLNDLLCRIDKRLRLMTDLLVELRR